MLSPGRLGRGRVRLPATRRPQSVGAPRGVWGRASVMHERMAEYSDTVRGRIHASGCFGAANSRMHRALERGLDRSSFAEVLEVGAGDLDHLPHVRHACSRYVAIDLRPPSSGIDPEALRPRNVGRLEVVQMDGQALGFDDAAFDRVVATCVLMHMEQPVLALNEWIRVTRPGGRIDLLVPCDPGLVLRLFRWFVNERAAQRFGVSRREYRLLNALDHVSSFARLHELARFVVEDDHDLSLRSRYLPFRIPSWNLNGFAVLTITRRPATRDDAAGAPERAA